METEIFNEEHPSKNLVNIKKESISINEKNVDFENFEEEIDVVDRNRRISQDLTNPNEIPKFENKKKN